MKVLKRFWNNGNEYKGVGRILEEYYKDKQLPETVQLYPAIKVIDVSTFVDSHLTVLRAHPYIKAFDPFRVRLIRLKNILEGYETEI
jgi:hypothetical protein